MIEPRVKPEADDSLPSSRQVIIDTSKLLGIMLSIEAAVVAYTIYTLGLYRDDRWFYFVLYNSIAAGPVVGTVIVYCLRWARGVIEFNEVLAAGEEPTPEQARRAIASVFTFARNGSLLLAALYTAATALFAMALYIWHDFSKIEALLLFAFKSFSGINLSVIFYYTIKIVERPHLGNAVSLLMARGDYFWEHFHFSVRYKIFLVIFCMVAYLVFAALLMGFNQVESVQIHNLQQNIDYWRQSLEQRLGAAADGSTESTFQNMDDRLSSDASLVILGPEGESLLGGDEELSPEEKEQALSATEPGRIMDYKAKRIVSFGRLPGDNGVLVLVGRWKKFASAGAATSRVIAALFIAAVILSVAATLMLVTDINTPLKGILKFLHGVSKGERGIVLREYSEDELGVFVRDLARTTSLLEDRTRRAEDLVARIEEIAQIVGQSFEKVKAATYEQALGVDVQADATGRASTISNEILKTSSLITEHAQEVRNSAELNLSSCREGDERVVLALEGFKEMGAYVEEISGAVLDLGNNIAKITSIVEIISEISDQISLLSLNAELEAAGAGELGTRFLTVAREVQRLANSTMEVVDNIARLVDSTVKSSDRAVDSARKGGELVTKSARLADAIGKTIGQIKTQAEATESAAAKISSASQRQMEESQKMANSIVDVDSTAHQIKENTARVQAAMEELSQAAQKLSARIQDTRQE